MSYEIEFEDQGQDLLRLTVDENTGEITDAGPFHYDLYVDGKHFVDVDQLTENRFVHHLGHDNKFFKWPMIKLSQNGTILADAT